MSFQLKRKESVAGGLQRIVREEFAAVAGHLRSLLSGGEKDEAIHDARRHLKRLRALIQIWREPLGEEVCFKETAPLRDVGQKLSAIRDLKVQMDLLSDLERDVSNDAGMRRILQRWTLQHRRELHAGCRPASVTQLLRTLDTSRRRFAAFPVLDAGWPVVADALCRSYRRARRAYAVAGGKAASAEKRHEWRKRAKVLEYQLVPLRCAHPEAAEMADKLHELTDCLGGEHDLAVLDQTLRAELSDCLTSADGREILSTVTKQRTSLIKRSRVLGRQIFSGKPDAFAACLEGWWQKWRE